VEALATELRVATAALVQTGAAYSLPGDDDEGDSTSSVIESAEDSASAEELVLTLAEFTAADLESGFPDLFDGDLSSDSSKADCGSTCTAQAASDWDQTSQSARSQGARVDRPSKQLP